MPTRSGLPYDTYLDITPDPIRNGSASTATCTTRLMPLLVTDEVTTASEQQTEENIRQLAISMAFLSPAAGGNVAGNHLSDVLNEGAGFDINSVLMLGRGSDPQSIRVRIGAQQRANSSVDMVARTYRITALLLSPQKEATVQGHLLRTIVKYRNHYTGSEIAASSPAWERFSLPRSGDFVDQAQCNGKPLLCIDHTSTFGLVVDEKKPAYVEVPNFVRTWAPDLMAYLQVGDVQVSAAAIDTPTTSHNKTFVITFPSWVVLPKPTSPSPTAPSVTIPPKPKAKPGAAAGPKGAPVAPAAGATAVAAPPPAAAVPAMAAPAPAVPAAVRAEPPVAKKPVPDAAKSFADLLDKLQKDGHPQLCVRRRQKPWSSDDWQDNNIEGPQCYTLNVLREATPTPTKDAGTPGSVLLTVSSVTTDSTGKGTVYAYVVVPSSTDTKSPPVVDVVVSGARVDSVTGVKSGLIGAQITEKGVAWELKVTDQVTFQLSDLVAGASVQINKQGDQTNKMTVVSRDPKPKATTGNQGAN